jgi:hypothetical protein
VPVSKESHRPVYLLIKTKRERGIRSIFDGESGSLNNDGFVPLESLVRRARKQTHVLKHRVAEGVEARMLGNPARDGRNTFPSISSEHKPNGGMVRRRTKAVPKLPRNGGRGFNIHQNARRGFHPNMVKLTEIGPTHEGRTIMSNFHKVWEVSIPHVREGFMKCGDRRINGQVTKPDSVVTKVGITAHKCSGTKWVGNAVLQLLEEAMTLAHSPGRGIVNANKEQVEHRKHTKDPKYPARNNAHGEAKKARGKKGLRDTDKDTPRVPIRRIAPKCSVRMFPFTGKGLALKWVSMGLANASKVATDK